jgi:hypothetical protein
MVQTVSHELPNTMVPTPPNAAMIPVAMKTRFIGLMPSVKSSMRTLSDLPRAPERQGLRREKFWPAF